MQRLQDFKFALMPNGERRRDMRRFAGSCRFVFNEALALQKANTEAGGTYIGYVAMTKHLTEWRNGPETPWLKEAPAHPLQHALKDLAQFACGHCGNEQHADVVGALNILARGHRVAACGEEGSGLGRKLKTKPASMKQEPPEATLREPLSCVAP